MTTWRGAAGATGGVLLIGMMAMLAGGAAAEDDHPLVALVAAERAFARMSIETSQREAFLANFAEDGVWFTPGPTNTKQALQKRPPSEGAGRVLDWDPITGDVAASGDIGYTTGPWVATERTSNPSVPLRRTTGWFFSVWSRMPGAGWKVLIDYGISAAHERTLRSQVFRRAEVRGVPAAEPADAKALADAVRAADVEFGRRVSSSGWAEALRAAATEDVLVYRAGREPSPGVKAAASGLPTGPWPATWTPSFGLSSSAGDLGVSYGAYAATGGPKPVRGYYLHVWKRTPSGWKLAVDIAK
jgi:ketosteroid isomerase-like protein